VEIGVMKKINLVREKFLRLTVVQEVPTKDKHHHRRYKCVCDCGNVKVVLQQNLLNGNTQSCGCLAKEKSIAVTGVPDSGFRALFQRYKRGAEERNLSWELTIEQFKNLTSLPCYYTGRFPSQTCLSMHSWERKRKGLPPRDGGVYIYNGVDRLDSSKGYTLENCVACCEDANMAKQSLSHNKFIELCREVANKHPKVQQ
jgi:hypothetical protein